MKKDNTHFVKIQGIEFVIKTDKNHQVCDIQPRIGDVHTTYQGRPLKTCANSLVGDLTSLVERMSEAELAKYVKPKK